MNAAAGRAGDTERVVELAHETLQLRLGVYEAESGPVAGAWYLIGSEYRKASRLQEAKEAIEKSLEIYSAEFAGREGKGSAILAKEQLCLILEDMDQLSDAKEARLQGASTGTMVCSSTKCPFGLIDFRIRNDGLPRLFKFNELKACSRCRSAF
ncbi:hypothetical protein ACET3X_007256 [Alternaria dauci]|uniref:Uncharacterized protein n=1 Tax=Alternaria dauci TaxID=48095 RepID=A0ABR3UCY3_9PLEO